MQIALVVFLVQVMDLENAIWGFAMDVLEGFFYVELKKKNQIFIASFLTRKS
jgi:hypothetical protein